jgi:PII-like signaling protein
MMELSSDLPIAIERVDAEPRIQLLLPHLQNMVREGMITMEYVTILMYQHGKEPRTK